MEIKLDVPITLPVEPAVHAASAHSTESSLREKIIEHLFLGDLLRCLWRKGIRDIEILRTEIDRDGYDLILEANGVVRHIQLKASHRLAKTTELDIQVSLERKPCACVIWIRFDPDSIEARAIKQDADYEGVRVTFRGHLQNARIPMQVDVAFGDVLYPIPPVTDYPTILDYAAPSLRVYSRESTIAEKFEAMVKLGQLNSRMKDFHDIWLLSRHFEFDGATLATAIERTFAHRGTTIASNPTAFSAAFTTDPAKVRQWQGFLRKSKLEGVPDELAIIVREIASFLGPTAEALSDKRSFSLTWQPPGPWSRS